MASKRHKLGGGKPDPIEEIDALEPLPLLPLPELEMSWDSEVIAAGRGHQSVRSNFSEKPEQWSRFFHDDPWGVHRTIREDPNIVELIERARREESRRLEEERREQDRKIREQEEIDWNNIEKMDEVYNYNVAMLPMPGNGDNVVPILERIERMMREVVG